MRCSASSRSSRKRCARPGCLSFRVYEILSRKRPLTLKMIWELHRKLGIPAETLVRPSKKARAA